MYFLTALAGLLAQLAKPLTGRVMLALGMSFLTITGVGAGVDYLLQDIKNNMASLDAQVLQFLAFMWVDKAIAMIFSAYAVAQGIKAAGGSITKLVTKGG